ncbi:hypothetical protein ACHAQH_003908 [Verticillium albo-atrum]
MTFNTPKSTRVRGRLGQRDRTPSKAPSSSRPPTSSRKQRLNGLYSDGIWYCNCEPRCEAKQYPVKKQGPNKGKLFWTCVVRACDFFIWEDDAAARTMGMTVSTVEDPVPQSSAAKSSPNDIKGKQLERAVPPSTAPANRSPKQKICDFFPKSPRIETANTAGRRVPVDISSDEDTAFQKPSNSALRTPKQTPSAFSKRKRDQAEEEDLIGDLSSDEERQLNDAVTRSSQKVRDEFLKPQSVFTPATARTTDLLNGMPTPATARTLFAPSDSKRLKTTTDESRIMSTGIDTPVQTPPTIRTRDALQISPAPHGDADVDLTQEVMTLLNDQHLPPVLARSLRDTLDRHAARARGLIMGRDAVRSQLRAKDERIAQLQERVVAVENKNKAMRASLTDMKAGLQNLYAQH